MNKRPTSLTIIAWILIVIGGISIISTAVMIDNPAVMELMRKSPLPIPLQYAMNFFGLLVMVVSGVGLLKGHNWARFLYVGWSAVGFVIGLATSPLKAALLPSLVFLVVVAFFLFRKKANDYFSQARTSDNAQPV